MYLLVKFCYEVIMQRPFCVINLQQNQCHRSVKCTRQLSQIHIPFFLKKFGTYRSNLVTGMQCLGLMKKPIT